jgi:hypothetical protein
VILLTLIGSAIGGTMLLMSNADHRIAANERDAERALAAARAGVSYGYSLFDQGLIVPSSSGTAFNSFATSVATPLEGEEFTGLAFANLLTSTGTSAGGQLYRIQATGTYRSSQRTVSMVFQLVPEAFKYGYAAFNEATLHNHSNLAGPTFKIQSTIFSNGDVSVPNGLTIDGTIVSDGSVTIGSGSTITRDIFADSVSNAGTIQGKVTRLTSVVALPATATTWARKDSFGNKYNWYNGNSTPGTYGGSGTLVGANTAYTIQNNDDFQSDIFTPQGQLLLDPDLNVTRYIAPPQVDYAAMKAEADLNDPTYFTSTTAAVTYLISKKVTETIGGKVLTTVKVGTPTRPEFLYIIGDLKLDVKPGNTDNAGSGVIQADGISIEGGIYITGDFDYDGANMVLAANGYPAPPDYYMLRINALPYCYPALLAYSQPTLGTVATWKPTNTPVMGSGSQINMSANGTEGPTLFNGVVFSQSDIHLHHTSNAKEVIRMNGSEMAWKIHNCDYFWFSYDPAVRCTRFLVTDEGTPQVVSMHEVR